MNTHAIPAYTKTSHLLLLIVLLIKKRAKIQFFSQIHNSTDKKSPCQDKISPCRQNPNKDSRKKDEEDKSPKTNRRLSQASGCVGLVTTYLAVYRFVLERIFMLHSPEQPKKPP